MTLHLTPEHLDAIRQHGERAFPQECCGLLLGNIELQDGQEHKAIEALWQVDNTWDSAENPVADGESKNRRFLIEPADFKRGYDYARSSGLGVVGTYHSHPNHPAIPSEFDRQHAFPWGYSCVIVSIMAGAAADLRSWVLDSTDRCIEQSIETTQPTIV
ncbi:M67 family metallopeptidase [Synechococcus sp. PCC 7336]|uniref:M67 family metallopeptidase n=1 Tax=Synechococcus sp. PCC 7336 TaxID=195250 RepID=UPI00034525C4|nr:M67 family metallopeptidase [Synechococcus sp. PCC 7336]